jgi:uncharacterized phiE125 gp8 family phage protein
VTSPTYEPISLACAKLWLRVDSTTEDALIGSLLMAARSIVEQITRRALVAQTWDWRLSEFPGAERELRLPKAPLQSVTSITYLDGAGALQTWSTDAYDVSAPAGPEAQMGRVQLAAGVNWPDTYDQLNAITVKFVAGYVTETGATLTSITQTAGTATATKSTAHGYQTGDLVLISGAAQADYNGVHEITVPTTTTFTFPAPSGTTTPATGTLTAARFPLPKPIAAAMKMLLAQWYDDRIAGEPPDAVKWLLGPFRVLGWD